MRENARPGKGKGHASLHTSAALECNDHSQPNRQERLAPGEVIACTAPVNTSDSVDDKIRGGRT
jgi:hypothetical protein